MVNEYGSSEFTEVYDESDRRSPTSVTRLGLLLVSKNKGIEEVDLASFHKEAVSIGRNQQKNDVCIPSAVISSVHVQIIQKNGAYFLVDPGSTNGTFYLNHGSYVRIENHRMIGPLADGMVFLLGSNRHATDSNHESVLMIITSAGERDYSSFPLQNRDYVIGRGDHCDIVIRHPAISREHAVIYMDNGRYAIQDRNSRNGVFINGKKLEQPVYLEEKDVIMIAGKMIIYSCNTLFLKMTTSGIELTMSHLTKQVNKGSKTILSDINTSIRSNEFVAIVGGSGAGKSTLLKIIGGYDQFYHGEVFYNGISLRNYYHILKNIIGYVPQEDIVYENLTLYKMLRYTAKMKMPDSTSDQEIHERILEVLNLVELQEHGNTMIKSLSGGQKKRASIAVELLADPGMFFLDEPTSGLDPGTEKKLMTVLHGLAKRQGKTIVMVTHTTQSLDLCDRIIFMGKGGRLAFIGTPQEAKAFFGTKDLIDIYNLLEDNTDDWADKFARSNVDDRQDITAGGQRIRKQKTKSALKQFGTLSTRYAELVINDRMRLFLLFIQPVLIALLLRVVGDKDNMFTLYEPTNQILFTYSCSAIWIGIFNTIQEVCKERAILKREYMSNLRLSTYILSKYTVQLVISFAQSFIFTTLFLLLMYNRNMPLRGMIGPYYLEVLITTWLTIFSSSAMGLLVSCMMKNVDRAMALSPFLLIVQLLFSGVLFENLKGISKMISVFTISRWSVSALGIITNLRSMNSKVFDSIQELNLGDKVKPSDFPVDSAGNFIHTGARMFGCWGMMSLYIILFGMLCIYFLQNVAKDR